jgi:hypothetical protein
MEVHWYCSCGVTVQRMDEAIAEHVVPSFVCSACGTRVGPVYESEEVIRHSVEEGEGC